MDDATVRSFREADGQDQGLARQAEGLLRADDDERFGRCWVEERGQPGFLRAHGCQGLGDTLGVAVGQGDDSEGPFGGFDGVLDDGVDDGSDLRGRRFDGVGAGGGHAGGLDPARGYGSVRGGPRNGDAGVLVAVASEEQRDLIVEAARAGVDAQGRQDVGERAGGTTFGGGGEVVDDDQLVAARDDGHKFGEGQAVCAVKHDDVDGTPSGCEHGHHGGDCHEDGQEVAHERVGDEQLEVGGCAAALEEFAQFLVLPGARGEGVRADPTHAGDGLRDERRDLGFVELAAFAGEVFKGGRVDAAEGGLGGQHGAQQGGPPGQVEFGVDLGFVDTSVGEVLGKGVEAVGCQARTHLQAGGDLAGGARVAGPAFNEGGQALHVGGDQVRFFVYEHGGDSVEVVAHGVGQG